MASSSVLGKTHHITVSIMKNMITQKTENDKNS